MKAPEIKVISINKCGEYLILRIPKPFARALDLKPKDKMAVKLEGEKLVCWKIKEPEAELNE